MSAHFTAVYGVFRAHALFDESMARLAHHRNATGLLHHLDGAPGQARIVDDFPTRLAHQQRGGKQADQVIAFNEVAASVEEKAAIKITVPGDAEVRTADAHCLGSGGAV